MYTLNDLESLMIAEHDSTFKPAYVVLGKCNDDLMKEINQHYMDNENVIITHLSSMQFNLFYKPSLFNEYNIYIVDEALSDLNVYASYTKEERMHILLSLMGVTSLYSNNVDLTFARIKEKSPYILLEFEENGYKYDNLVTVSKTSEAEALRLLLNTDRYDIVIDDNLVTHISGETKWSQISTSITK